MTDPQRPYGPPPPYQQSGYQPPQYPPQPYPPQPGYQQPIYGQPPYPVMMPMPKKSNTTAWVLGIIGGVVVLAVLGCIGLVVIGAHGVQQDQVSANGDVRITSCATQDMLGTSAGNAVLSITNHTTSSRNYFVTVAFDSSGGGTQYDTAFATVDNLAPGQTTTASAAGFKQVGGAMVCKIVSVSRI